MRIYIVHTNTKLKGKGAGNLKACPHNYNGKNNKLVLEQ